MENEVEKDVKVAQTKKKSITIKLEDPIQWGEETIEEVILKPIRGKHIKNLPAQPALKDLLVIASKISGVSSAVFDEMASSDIMKIAEAVGELL